MDIDRLQAFLLWSLVVNAGIYVISLVGVLSVRPFVCKIHMKLFGVSEDTANTVMYQYLAIYKLLLIVFNLVPWIAISLIQ